MSNVDKPVPTVQERYGARADHYREMGLWQGGSASELLDRWAREQPTRIAFTDGTNTLDYAGLRDRAYSLARQLKELGVKRGDRVVMQVPNWNEAAIIYHAVCRLGAVIAPVIMVYRHAELRQILNNSGATVAFTTGQFRSFDHAGMFRELRAECPTLKHVIQARPQDLLGDIEFEAVSAAADAKGLDAQAEFGPYADPDQPHVLIYTSGTESVSKGCTHTWNTFNFSAQGLCEKIFEMRPDDTMFMPSPVGHATGMMMGVVVPLNAGAGSHLLDVWEPGEGLRRIAKYRCTASAGATPFVRMAIDAARDSGLDLSSMRSWLCAGAPIPVSLADELKTQFPNCQLLQLYGCSEINMMVATRRSDPPALRDGTAGSPVLGGIESRLVKPDGTQAQPGEEGEVWYRGPGLMLGYWRDPERTANAIDPEGWYHTSDLCVMDEQRFTRVSGRIKDIIIRGGSNISAGEIENYLLAHPRIKNASVVGFPDDRLGERVCAYVVTTPGEPLTLQEVVAFLRDQKISPQKLPERLEVVENFPMTATGKVQKFRLRQMAAGQA
ncbi:MAG TPA: AMP-binding protein [Ramlibacter sp.]|nr:AMP-binding protein [Ramlibacter sp.]